MSENLQDLLQRAIATARAGQKEEARLLLVQVLKANPRSETAWLWMSAVVEKPAERIHCLKQVLAINPQNETALKGLRALGVAPAEQPPGAPQPAPGAAAVPQPAPIASAPPPPAPGGVPLVSEEAIRQAQLQAEAILGWMRAAEERVDLNISWGLPEVLRTRPRTGIDLRPSPMMIAVGAGVVLVIMVVLLVSNITRMIRAAQMAAHATPAATATVAQTSISTPTPRPTRTPTPEGQVVPEEPILPIQDVARGDLRFGITPTPPYVITPHPSSPLMNDAIQAFYERRYRDSLELIAQARGFGYDSIDSYYFEGMALAYLGEYDQALQALEQGFDSGGEDFAPLYAGLGYVYARQGAIERARNANERAKSLDPRLIMAYVNLAQLYLDQRQFDAALSEVSAGREIRKYDVNLMVMASKIYLASGDAQNAAAYANLAHYMDPISEEVVLAQARGRLALGFDMLAAIGLEDYLEQVNPGSYQAWALLGQAYGKLNREQDAMLAFSRALQLSTDVAPALIGRGLYYFDQEQYDLAYQDLSAAVEVAPDDLDLRYARARAAFALRDFEIAVEDLAFIRDKTPGRPDIEILYVQALAETGENEEALEAANAALSTLSLDRSQRGYLLETRARAYYSEGDYSAAQQNIAEALQIEETGTRHYYNALILSDLGQTAQAIRELEWVLFWNQVFAYPFAEDAATILDKLYVRLTEEYLALTPSPTPTPTLTPTRTPTPTLTPRPSATPRPSVTPSPSATPLPSETPRPSVTPTTTLTLTLTRTPRPTATPMATSTP